MPPPPHAPCPTPLARRRAPLLSVAPPAVRSPGYTPPHTAALVRARCAVVSGAVSRGRVALARRAALRAGNGCWPPEGQGGPPAASAHECTAGGPTRRGRGR